MARDRDCKGPGLLPTPPARQFTATQHTATQTDSPTCCAAVLCQLWAVQRELVDTRRQLQQALGNRPAPVPSASSSHGTAPRSLNKLPGSAADPLMCPEARTQPEHNPMPPIEFVAVPCIPQLKLLYKKPHRVFPAIQKGVQRPSLCKQLRGSAARAEPAGPAVSAATALHSRSPATAQPQEGAGKSLAPGRASASPANSTVRVPASHDASAVTLEVDLITDSDTGSEWGSESSGEGESSEVGTVTENTTEAQPEQGSVEDCSNQRSHCHSSLPTNKEFEMETAGGPPGLTEPHCMDSGQVFSSVDNLPYHTAAAHSQPSISRQPESDADHIQMRHLCTTCGKTFGHLGGLKTHELTVHEGKRPYACSHCGHSCSSSTSLRNHVKAVHLQERPHQCSVCGRCFSQRSTLKRHEMKHSGTRPYVCNVCGASFIQSYALKVHTRLHTGEQPFMCSVCGRGFVYRNCLQAHELTHTGGRPYVCEVCGKRFAGRASLITHRMRHTGQRPYGCSTCGQRFRQKHHLASHAQSQHPKLPVD